MESTSKDGFWKQVTRSFARAPLPSITLAVLVIFLAVVLFRIATADVSIPVVSDDVEAATRANERMLQMVQWALSTALGLGLALIGINWFTTTRDRAEIADLERSLESAITDYRDRVAELDERITELNVAMWPAERKAIQEEIMDRYWKMPESSRSHPQMCAMVFRESTDAKRKRAAAEILMEAPMRHVTEDSHPCTVDAHDTIVNLIPDLAAFDPALAMQAYFIASRDLELLNTIPKEEWREYQSTLPPPPQVQILPPVE